MSDDGGPAFPVADVDLTDRLGLSIRDYFAARAMAVIGPPASGVAADMKRRDHEYFAKRCYEIADYMLEARRG